MGTFKLVKGDLTEQDVEAVVNAANSHLQMGGGVAGAILKKGGEAIQNECDKVGFTPVGCAAITTGGRLKAKYVIHAVGPRMGEGDEDNKLKSATLSALKISKEKSLPRVAFPAISTGIFGYPKDKCAKIMISTVRDFIKKESYPKEVIICLYDESTYNIFKKEAEI